MKQLAINPRVNNKHSVELDNRENKMLNRGIEITKILASAFLNPFSTASNSISISNIIINFIIEESFLLDLLTKKNVYKR